MSDMPDFDSMTPEEMMKWMESLAVRQGATEGLTTEADMDIEEVSADDARLEGMGEYKPYGMSDEEWERLQAKDEANKQARLQARAAQEQAAPPKSAAATPPPPAPEPEPEPAAASASSGDMPDFDSMTPEEMMKWMESLAVRQGATEGLTTEADMDIEEVSADDARLEGMGEYKPYGMSDEEWERLQAKDEADKQARLQARAAQQATPPKAAAATPPPVPEPEPEIAMADLSELGLDEPEIEMADLSELGLEEPEEEETVAAEFDFDALDLDEEPEAVSESPMDWLSDLAGGDESGGLDFDMDSLGALEGLGEAQSSGDPMDWLQGLAADDSGDALSGLTEMTGDAEGSLEWMESLARKQGADSQELVTSADLDIPSPSSVSDDGPGYEEFSFEEGTGVVQDTDQLQAILGTSSDESEDLKLENPEAWLDQLASGGGSVIEDEDEDAFSSENWVLQEDEDAEELDYDSISGDLTSKLSSGTAAPEDIEAFFTAAFQQAAKRTDVPDYIDSEEEEEEEVAAPVQAEIPDWLQESMAAAPEEEEEVVPATPRKTTTAEMMAAELFGSDSNNIEEAELPDWLQAGMDEDSGDISADIFAMEEDEEEPATASSAIDTSDSWVQAFSDEDSPELESWYESAVAKLEGGETAAAASVPAPTTLQAANLPVESDLQEGTPQGVPAWMGAQTASSAADSMEVASVGADMDWLGTDETEAIDDDMPDWLKETVDDSVTVDEEMPSWLQGEAANVAVDEIPDWLKETMDEEEEVEAMDFLGDDEIDDAAVAAVFSTTPTPPPTPAAPPAPVPARQSPAPVPVPVANIDIAATMQSAQEKIKANDLDGGLLDYEQVVRANAALPQVEAAVKKLADNERTKKHPAVHRVLGDVLMRQGKLQEALDTYRKALNLL